VVYIGAVGENVENYKKSGRKQLLRKTEKKKTIIQHLALKSNHTLHLIDENKTLRVMKVLSYEIVSNKIIINSTAS